MEITLDDLVANRTMPRGLAELLVTAASEKRSTLMVAVPRLAGKTTTTKAILAHRPQGTPLHQLSEQAGESLGLPAEDDGGYLVMSEVSEAPLLDYLWGHHVRTVFKAAAERDFPLATSLHEAGLNEAFEVICRQNAVPDQHASVIDLVLYLRSLGDDWRNPTRRVVAAAYEVNGVSGGQPQARLLYQWNEATDAFEHVADPLRMGTGTGSVSPDTVKKQDPKERTS